MKKWYVIGVLAAMMCALSVGAWAADYYVVKKASGELMVSDQKAKGDARVLEGPFSSKEEARQALQQMKKEGKDRGRAEGKEGRREQMRAKSIDKMGGVRSSYIIGVEVENKQGEDLGSIEEMVIAGEGKVVYVILAHGGFLGIGDKLIPIPWDALKYDPANKVAIIAVEKQQLEDAPNFAEDDWPNLDEPGWRDKLDKYYENMKREAKSEM